MTNNKDYPMWVCHDCGDKYQTTNRSPRCSTWHEGICGICLKLTAITEPRDYGYPDFTKCLTTKESPHGQTTKDI